MNVVSADPIYQRLLPLQEPMGKWREAFYLVVN